ncbi:MAG: PepSY-like domain-containing protein [Bacteroidota bacterium]|nr:PepSY-like domain-containing protein [Bacteroidota bacterium]
MKKTLMLLICVAFMTSGIVLAQKKETVPVSTKSTFATKFPKAQKVKWSVEKPGEFEAEFQLNGVESSALFDSKGTLLVTETEIKESQLPQTVKAAITKNFAGYKLDEIEKATDAKGAVSYEMEAAKGKEKLEISFDATGKLLKKEAVKEEKGKEKKD